MSLTNEQYDTIMRIYSRRQADNRFRQKERQQAVYDAIPAFADLETEISSLQASRARLMPVSYTHLKMVIKIVYTVTC